MKITSILSTNQQLPVSGKATGVNAFQIVRNVYLLPLKPNHQIFPILTTCQFFCFFLPESASFEDSLIVKVIEWKFE